MRVPVAVMLAVVAVDRFEIVLEYHDFAGMQFWFDDLRVAKPATAR
jgi:hypothetical protein